MEDCIKQGSYMKDDNFDKNDCHARLCQLDTLIVVFLRCNNFFIVQVICNVNFYY